MRGKPTLAALGLISAGVVAAATAGEPAAPEDRPEAVELRRAQLEQELIMAEGTAGMYGQLEHALHEMRGEEASR